MNKNVWSINFNGNKYFMLLEEHEKNNINEYYLLKD